MTLANDSVLVTPGSGATMATHLVSSKEHQVVMVADSDGHIKGSPPVYKAFVMGSAVGANKVHMDLFNATGSGLILRILSAKVIPDIDTAIVGVVGIEANLTRTTAVGTGGTAMTLESTSLTAPAINKQDTNSVALSASVTMRSAPAGGATAGAFLGVRWIMNEETSASAGLAGALGVEYVAHDEGIVVRENTGVRFVQGAVAGLGTLAFEITFEAT